MLLIDRLNNTFYQFKHIINSIINDQKYFAFKKAKIQKKKNQIKKFAQRVNE